MNFLEKPLKPSKCKNLLLNSLAVC